MRVLLVEKTDRLYRNLKDWVTVDELEVEIHLVKEDVVLSRESRSSEKFMHGIKVLMAKNYIDNLSEEARKGMLEKAEQGIWPSMAPLGYRNVLGPDGRRAIAADPAVAPLITKLFEWYATGTISLKEAARQARAAGLVYRKSGAPVPVSTVHKILRNRLYSGAFEWNGRQYQGRHEQLVSIDMDRVQSVLDGRNAKKHRRVKHNFAFSGLIACGRCGCSVVGEIKKERYVYYHCTGYADKCLGEPATCRRRYVREEVLEQQFTELLGRLQFDAEVLEWVREALHASHADEKREHDAAIERLQAEHRRLQARLDAMYVDKLDGHVDVGPVRAAVSGMARRAGAMPVGNRPAPGGKPLLHGRGSPASRTGAKCPVAVRTAGTAGEAPPAQLRAIELHVGERWRSGHLPPTF